MKNFAQSALEALCVSVQGRQVLQLRQLTALVLHCIVGEVRDFSGGYNRGVNNC